MTAQPRSRPQLNGDVARQVAYRLILADPNVQGHWLIGACPVLCLAVRGYYADTIGTPGRNDYGVWDDALFLVTPEGVTSYNSNCDPSRTGYNPGVDKFYAQLQTGVWPFREGPHKGAPNHFRQLSEAEAVARDLDQYFTDRRARGHFAVRRVEKDGVGRVEWGYQAINIHEGSRNGTSSWGCQTLPPDQWREFQVASYAALAKHGQAASFLPYVLTDERLS